MRTLISLSEASSDMPSTSYKSELSKFNEGFKVGSAALMIRDDGRFNLWLVILSRGASY